MATKKKEVIKNDNGKHTQRFAERPGYAERIPKKKVKSNAGNDTAKDSGTDSEV
jgi:hypothetical protein